MRWFGAIVLFVAAAIECDAQLDSVLIQYYQGKHITLDTCSDQKLYDEACYWMDTPYQYAGRSVNGLDCSGLVKNLYESVYNTTLGGGSKDIFTLCIPIAKEQLQEGDLVFFKISGNRISHIGLYLANNKFIHASTRLGVIVSDLDEPYYTEHFFSGGRLANFAHK